MASTSLEYKTIWEYQNFIYLHPNVKQIVPSHDLNKNFKILLNLKKQYPNIDIEIMVNEGCLQGCPNRNIHEMSDYTNNKIINNNNLTNSALFCTSFCSEIQQKFPIYSLVVGNNIYPWELKNYEQINITKFKLVGRDSYIENFKNYLNDFTSYLKCIDDIKSIENCALSDFTHHLKNHFILKKLTVKHYKKYLPNINHFKKYGHLCASRCGVECRYCYKCAEKIQRVFEKKQKELTKRTIPVCFINK